MNKGVSAGALGATLLASILFQAKPHATPDTRRDKATTARTTADVLSDDGPWVASCSYWSAVQPVNDSDQRTADGAGITIAQAGGAKLQLKPSDDKSGCGDGGWAIPSLGDHSAEISAIIATVPDPIHSHLALDFDRAIDAILLAAADNHYLGSYYWLPWRSQISTSAAGDSTATAAKPTAKDTARELQPGLIILRYAPDRESNDFSWKSYHRVVYLFLVAETPALGVNGNQLQRAFAYEKMLKYRGARLSIWPTDENAESESGKAARKIREQQAGALRHMTAPIPCADRLSIIGPSYSGSAAALRSAIDAAPSELRESEDCVSITGATSTTDAVEALDPKEKVGSSQVGSSQESRSSVYRSFGENTNFERARFLQSLVASGYDLSRVAVLSEAGTVFGASAGRSIDQLMSTSGSKCKAGEPGCFRVGVDVNLLREGGILSLRFPRELSLLRNAEANQSAKTTNSVAPTPYLDLSLKDQAADDTVPRFSTNQSPLSIEAQLIGIANQLQSARSQFVIISASNILDDIFLAQFLHRACPDARLVFLSGGDLLFEREGENSPYIGSVSISPYLLSSLNPGDRLQGLHAGYQAEEIYNAASFTFHPANSPDLPVLAGYRSYPTSGGTTQQQIPLWASAVGADRYYPLAVLNWCGSDQPEILPTLKSSPGEFPRITACTETDVNIPSAGPPAPRSSWNSVPDSINENSGISPTLPWLILGCLIFLTSIGHCIFLAVADLWSPFTRDLAIDSNDLPYRRAVYLNIGTSMLAAAAFVTAYPLLRVGHYFSVTAFGKPLAWLLLIALSAACIFTAWRTWRYFYHSKCRIYTFFNAMSLLALIGIPYLWSSICNADNPGGYHSYAGLYFSYRCLHPFSGVSPLLPVLLLLLAWYLWAIYQTARLRFSPIHRPRIARRPDSSGTYEPKKNAYLLFVPDNALERCDKSTDNCLYANITCLLITREILWRFLSKLNKNSESTIGRFAGWLQKHLDIALGFVYLALFCLCMFAIDIRSLDRFLFIPIFPSTHARIFDHLFFDLTSSSPTHYELLIKTLFFPLIMLALSGWLRVIFIWGSLNRGLLEPLERMPIRFAFTRYKGGGWMTMLRQKGLHIRWRDMGRSTESIRQIVHHPELVNKHAPLHVKLSFQYQAINAHIHELMESIATSRGKPPASTSYEHQAVHEMTSKHAVEAQSTACEAASQTSDDPIRTKRLKAKELESPCPSESLWDLPRRNADLCSIFHIEEGYSKFCTLLIDDFLNDQWDQHRTGFVEDVSLPSENNQIASKESKPSDGSPPLIEVAEELIVLRYVALIRAVLINIRYQMLIVGTIFVLALVAWNSYPFQPHAFIDWCFTLLLVTLGLGFIWVFAQMHRSAILSRITNTKPNELGWEFYLRIATFGAVPVLTWLAYQFPEIGGSLYKILQPGLQVVK